MIYDSMEGRSDRRIAFITTDDSGKILSSTVSGDNIIVNCPGHTFIVDDYVAEQITKFKVVSGQLELIDGEQLDVPVKTEIQLEEERLMQRLAEIQKAKESDTQ